MSSEETVFDFDKEYYLELFSKENHLDSVAKALAFDTLMVAGIEMIDEMLEFINDNDLTEQEIKLKEKEKLTLLQAMNATHKTYLMAVSDLKKAKKEFEQ